jgi:hypothetical protein
MLCLKKKSEENGTTNIEMRKLTNDLLNKEVNKDEVVEKIVDTLKVNETQHIYLKTVTY